MQASLVRKAAVRNHGDSLMEKFIHEQNLVLFRKRLAEVKTDAERELLIRLLAVESAKAPQQQD